MNLSPRRFVTVSVFPISWKLFESNINSSEHFVTAKEMVKSGTLNVKLLCYWPLILIRLRSDRDCKWLLNALCWKLFWNILVCSEDLLACSGWCITDFFSDSWLLPSDFIELGIFFCFILRFWNQILIWRSERPKVLAKATLRGLQMYLEK